jgi:hypothetical protein
MPVIRVSGAIVGQDFYYNWSECVEALGLDDTHRYWPRARWLTGCRVYGRMF